MARRRFNSFFRNSSDRLHSCVSETARRRMMRFLAAAFVIAIGTVLIPRMLIAQSCTISECPNGDSDCPGGLVCINGLVCGCSDACDDPSCDPNYDCDCLDQCATTCESPCDSPTCPGYDMCTCEGPCADSSCSDYDICTCEGTCASSSCPGYDPCTCE